MSDAISVRFAGAYRDATTAGYPLGDGYRWYLPGLMRFNASDDASPFDAGGTNPYAYCGDDPVNHRDPSGRVSLGVLTRLFGRSASEVGASSRDAPIAAERAAGASADVVPTREMHESPPAYRPAPNAFEAPPAYQPVDTHPPSLLPSFYEVAVVPIYREIRSDLSLLYRDMGDEFLRVYGDSRGTEARLPGVGDVVTAFFVDRQNWRQLRARRVEELARREDNLSNFHVRLRYVERRIRQERALDGEPALRERLTTKLKESQRLYRFLKS